MHLPTGNTLPNGSGITYAGGTTFPMGSANVILYAIWTTAYSVLYNANCTPTSGNVPTDSTYYAPGATVVVLGQYRNLTRTGYAFAGWNTQSNGSGTTYTQGQVFSMDPANVTLYAVWTHTYNVTYDPNGSTGRKCSDLCQLLFARRIGRRYGNPGSLVRTSFVFAGWNTQANGSGTTYTHGQSFTMGSANMTLYAAWTPTYSVTYNANGSTGGSVPTDSNHYLQGATVTVLGAGSLINTGYAFAGWTASTTGVAGASYSIGSTFKDGFSQREPVCRLDSNGSHVHQFRNEYRDYRIYNNPDRYHLQFPSESQALVIGHFIIVPI